MWLYNSPAIHLAAIFTMTPVLVFTTILAVAHAIPHNPRIIGGTISKPHQWPHMAALFVDGNSFCGGSLISPDWILTAAHCVKRASKVEVTLGAHNLQHEESSQVYVTSHDVTVHEGYGVDGNRDDIALVKLPQPVQINENIAPIPLANEELKIGVVMTAMGWGVTFDGSSATSDVLRQVNMNIADIGVCDVIYGPQGDGMLCVDASEGGICDGDSGGPLIHEGRVFGITSYASGLGCESGWPEGFTKVFHYLDWIQEHTGITA